LIPNRSRAWPNREAKNNSCIGIKTRPLSGTYIAVEPFHLDRYIGEQIFRFNNRATPNNPLTNADRFALALSQIAGKRLQLKELTGKVPGSC
jgi:hypothetical protein